jgi:hypothetical protein
MILLKRLTLRFEWLAPDVYVAALEEPRESGRPVFVVLDESEREGFRARYASVAKSVFGEPISAHGKTVVPVAKVAYGFGWKSPKRGHASCHSRI